MILPERISKEPLSPVVWGGDPEWTTLIRWVLNVLILAEEYGVTRDNLDALIAEGANPLVRRSADEREMIARSLGIEPRWGPRIDAGRDHEAGKLYRTIASRATRHSASHYTQVSKLLICLDC